MSFNLFFNDPNGQLPIARRLGQTNAEQERSALRSTLVRLQQAAAEAAAAEQRLRNSGIGAAASAGFGAGQANLQPRSQNASFRTPIERASARAGSAAYDDVVRSALTATTSNGALYDDYLTPVERAAITAREQAFNDLDFNDDVANILAEQGIFFPEGEAPVFDIDAINASIDASSLSDEDIQRLLASSNSALAAVSGAQSAPGLITPGLSSANNNAVSGSRRGSAIGNIASITPVAGLDTAELQRLTSDRVTAQIRLAESQRSAGILEAEYDAFIDNATEYQAKLDKFAGDVEALEKELNVYSLDPLDHFDLSGDAATGFLESPDHTKVDVADFYFSILGSGINDEDGFTFTQASEYFRSVTRADIYNDIQDYLVEEANGIDDINLLSDEEYAALVIPEGLHEQVLEIGVKSGHLPSTLSGAPNDLVDPDSGWNTRVYEEDERTVMMKELGKLLGIDPETGGDYFNSRPRDWVRNNFLSPEFQRQINDVTSVKAWSRYHES